MDAHYTGLTSVLLRGIIKSEEPMWAAQTDPLHKFLTYKESDLHTKHKT